MDEKKIKDWIGEANKRGVDRPKIEAELKKQGYDSSLINKTLNPKIKITFFALITLGILALLIGGYFLVLKPFVFTNDMKQAEQFFNERKMDKAIGLYQKVLANNPDPETSYIANRDVGTIYYGKEDYDKAMLYYIKAIELRPDIAYMATRNLGIIYYRKNDYNNSLGYLYWALNITSNPEVHPVGLEELYFYLGVSHARIKEYNQAAKYYRKIIEMPEDQISPYYLGLSYFRLGMYDKAEFYLSNLDEFFKEHPVQAKKDTVERALKIIQEKKSSNTQEGI